MVQHTFLTGGVWDKLVREMGERVEAGAGLLEEMLGLVEGGEGMDVFWEDRGRTFRARQRVTMTQLPAET